MIFMLFLGILFILVSNAVTFRRDVSILFGRLSILILVNASILLTTNLHAGAFTFLAKSISLFGGLVFCSCHNFFFILFIFIITILILSLNSFYPRKRIQGSLSIDQFNKMLNKFGEQFRIVEYPLIILFVIKGSVFLIASSDLVTLFLALELQSYGLYLLSSVYRNSELATNAGLTYFLLGSLASCIILLGISILYINTGNTSLDSIYIIYSILSNNVDVLGTTSNTEILGGLTTDYIQISFSIISIGLLVKISASPFHFWSPDVYDAIPTIVTTFVSIIAKISILLLLFEFVYYTNNTMVNYSWKSNLLLSSSLSLIIGSLLGLTQTRIKRLLAYSTISHLGFILLALSVNSVDSIISFFFYLLQYSITNLNAFICIIAIGYSFLGLHQIGSKVTNKSVDIAQQDLKDQNLSPIQWTRQLRGFYFLNPFLALSLTITLFSFIGVPPLLGFFAKQMVLMAALDQGYIFISLLAIITSVISAVYYLVVIKEIFFSKPEFVYSTVTYSPFITLSACLTLIISILTLLLFFFLFFPTEILDLTTLLSILIFYN